MDKKIIRYIDLPSRVRGITVMDEEGDFNIYINSALSPEIQKEALRHELAHVQRDDHYRTEEPLETVENF